VRLELTDHQPLELFVADRIRAGPINRRCHRCVVLSLGSPRPYHRVHAAEFEETRMRGRWAATGA
jgi:hypothetical protein